MATLPCFVRAASRGTARGSSAATSDFGTRLVIRSATRVMVSSVLAAMAAADSTLNPPTKIANRRKST
jgi:hypothetical protein